MSEDISKLKVGDSVVIDNGRLCMQMRYTVGKITKITPTGRIQVDGKEPKYKDGMISGDRYRETKVLHVMCSDWEEVAFRCKMIWNLKNMKFDNCSTEELRGIQKVFRWAKN